MSFDTWFNNQYDRRASSSVGYAHDGPLVLGFDQHGAGRCGYPAYRDFSDGYSAMPYADDRSYGWAARGTFVPTRGLYVHGRQPSDGLLDHGARMMPYLSLIHI